MAKRKWTKFLELFRLSSASPIEPAAQSRRSALQSGLDPEWMQRSARIRLIAAAMWERNREISNPQLDPGYELLPWHEECVGLHRDWLSLAEVAVVEMEGIDGKA